MYSYNEMPIITKDLEKKYYPEKIVLEGINLSVVEGETIGILGNNGAGKTTLLRILATLLYPSYGFIEIFGMDPRSEAKEIKKLIGYLPERFSFYPYFSVNDILDFFQRLAPTNRIDQEELREQVIKLLKMESYLHAQINTLSKGMLHKVGLAITLIHDPPLLLLDEPTTGLHFADIHNLLNVLQRLCDMGNTVVVIEHNLDVIKMADYIIDLGPEGGEAGGKIVVAGAPEEIIKNRRSYTAKYLKSKLDADNNKK